YSFLFFFSSRRRHTRSYGDWSSDVCSSDLFFRALGAVALMAEVHRAVALIDVDVAGGIAADRCDHRRTVRQPAVVGAIQVVLRRRLQAGEVAVAEIDSMVAEEFHPLAIVDRHRRV